MADFVGFCHDFICQFSELCGMAWRKMAVFVVTMADFIMILSVNSARFLIAFLSVLCVLCGKAFVAVHGGKWRILSHRIETLYARKSLSFEHKTRIKPIPLAFTTPLFLTLLLKFP